jgi:hypothetical protein
VTPKDNFAKLNEQYQVGLSEEPFKVQFEALKEMKGVGGLKDFLVEQDEVQLVIQFIKVPIVA